MQRKGTTLAKTNGSKTSNPFDKVGNIASAS